VKSFDRGTKSPLGALVGRVRSWIVLLLAVVVAGLAITFGGSPSESSVSDLNLPPDSDAATVTELQRTLPGSRTSPAIVVFHRDAGLEPADREAITAAVDAAAKEAETEAGPPIPSDDDTTVFVPVPVSSTLTADENEKVVDGVRDAVTADLPDGLSAEVTGPPAFRTDLGAVFAGADVRLLVVTALVVAVLLLVTYRSPWLWLVPLTVVGVGDQVAAKTVAFLSRTVDLDLNGGVTGITSVLVFGAGTNYALLLIARYREELRRHDDRHDAMRTALGSAAPAILASSGTVVLALLSLGLASAPFSRAIGYAGAVGIVVAVVFALVVLPAAMVVCGRWLFWPFVPRAGQDEPQRTGPWARVGEAVVRRPVVVVAVSVVTLGILAAGSIGVQAGLSQTEQFRATPESVTAQQTLEESYEGSVAAPTTIIAKAAAADQVAKAAADVEGVERAEVADADDRLARIDVVLTPEPGSADSFATIEELRDVVGAVDGADALVGGTEAADLDSRDGAVRDRLVIIPVILLIVLGVLLVLLRSVVAAVVLVATVVASYAAAMGAGWFAFTHWFDFPALDLGTPLLAFLFLVALGVDYNIFLTTRAREETVEHGVRGGIVTALAVTGGVITSAGILLAAVFAVLGVLPLITLTQLGVIVGFGVLLDTLLVRTLLVPAIVSLLDRRFWWPGALSKAPADEARPAGAHART
jgi:RND superfamily putative drug exporter